MKNTPLYKEIGTYLKDCRVTAGVTQAQLANKLGYSSPQFVSNCERGVCGYPDAKLKRMPKLVGANKRSLFTMIVRSTGAHYTKLLKL